MTRKTTPLNLIRSLCLILIASSFTLTSEAQSSVYRPFPTTHGTWVYQKYDDFGRPTHQFSEIELRGDTTLGGHNYKKILSSNHYLGGLRESNKVVYFFADTASQEHILYDFNYEQGDTVVSAFRNPLMGNQTVTVLSSTDTTLVSDGWRRSIFLSSQAVWIEGIGNIYGFFTPVDIPTLSSRWLIECMSGDSVNYPTSSISCGLSSPETLEWSKPLAYPNPSDGRIKIDLVGGNGLVTVTVRNALGMQLEQLKLSATSIELELPDQSGYYLIEVRSSEGRTTVVKALRN